MKSRRLLIIKLDGIGDYILFRNFLSVISNSKKYKNYEISLLGNSLWKDLALELDNGYVDKFIWIDIKRFSQDKIYRRFIFLKLKFLNYDQLISPTLSRRYFIEDDIISRIKAKHKIGSYGDLSNINKSQKAKSDQYYNELIYHNPIYQFEFVRNLYFFQNILQQQVLKVDRPFIDIKNKNSDEILIFPFAGEGFREWGLNNYFNLAKIISTHDSSNILICGPQGMNELVNENLRKLGNSNKIFNHCGLYSLDRVLFKIASSKYIITNETGIAHISAALNKRAIIISNGNHYGRFHPYPPTIENKNHYIYVDKIDKMDENLRITKYYNGSKENINTISVEKVLKQITSLSLLPMS